MIGCQDLKRQILHVLTKNFMIEITSRDVQIALPKLIEKEFGQQVTPETVARVWREMRSPEGGKEADALRLILCREFSVKRPRRRSYTLWKIDRVRVGDQWIPWTEHLKEASQPCLDF